MSANTILQELYEACEMGENVIPDPGDGGTIRPTKQHQMCRLTIGGTETRVLAAATSLPEGLALLIVANQITSGDATIEGAVFDSEGESRWFTVSLVNGTKAWLVQDAVGEGVTPNAPYHGQSGHRYRLGHYLAYPSNGLHSLEYDADQ
jgi:hypothetical protein